jgi:hypothetical protein
LVAANQSADYDYFCECVVGQSHHFIQPFHSTFVNGRHQHCTDHAHRAAKAYGTGRIGVAEQGLPLWILDV